jgi:hypothetical protein
MCSTYAKYVMSLYECHQKVRKTYHILRVPRKGTVYGIVGKVSVTGSSCIENQI